MSTITVQRSEGESEVIKLKYGELTIGRSKDNDIQVSEPTVSGKHAKIYTFFNASYIEDLNSTNGTFVNGKRVKKHTLYHGDVIGIGKCQLLFESPL